LDESKEEADDEKGAECKEGEQPQKGTGENFRLSLGTKKSWQGFKKNRVKQ